MELLKKIEAKQAKLGVIGLGYVGLPLAVEFGKHFPTVGFDINQRRIAELKSGQDGTLEVSPEELATATQLEYSADLARLRKCTFFIVTVPTPIDQYKRPDLTPLVKASETLGKVLKQGDVVNIDVTVIKDGYHGDTSRMFFVGEPSILAKRLSDITYESMWLGISRIKPGTYLGDLGHVIQQYAEEAGFSVVREFCGRGIGKVFHEEPQVLHYGRPGTLAKLEAGMIFTVEPMINAGRREIREMSDGWTIKTRDRSLSAQWEHTVLVTESGYEVLTLSAGSPPPPAFITAPAADSPASVD